MQNNFLFNKIIFYKKKKKINNKNKFEFKFSFVSLIPPFIINNIRFFFNKNDNEKKILLKQSYIILTWFYYISFIQKKIDNKNKLKIFVLPVKNNKFTLTKAPMAHKNWSKEQYKFSHYKFKINFKFFLKDDNSLNSINSSLFFILLTKKNFPNLETNIFFLKNIKFLFFFKDFSFFNYNYFLFKKLL